MKKCYVCLHPERQRIDEAIIAGQPNLRIAKAFGVSRDSVRRHNKHVAALVRKYDSTQELALAGSLKAKIQLREADLLRFQLNAEQKGDLPTAISATSELRRFYELTAKLEGTLKPEQVAVMGVTMNLDEETSRRIAKTYLERHPRNQGAES
jgi:hypothetical protein